MKLLLHVIDSESFRIEGDFGAVRKYVATHKQGSYVCAFIKRYGVNSVTLKTQLTFIGDTY